MIQFLCGNLGVNGRTEHPFELEEDVWQREEIVTTGVGFGVAIPHTKSQWIRHSSISIARLVKPVDWQSEMGEVELVIMLTLGTGIGSALVVDGKLVPNTELGHLQFKGGIAEKYCSASIMLGRAGVDITHSYEIVELG